MICLTENFNKRRELLSMKSITEILGGSQMLLGISYPKFTKTAEEIKKQAQY